MALPLVVVLLVILLLLLLLFLLLLLLLRLPFFFFYNITRSEVTNTALPLTDARQASCLSNQVIHTSAWRSPYR